MPISQGHIECLNGHRTRDSEYWGKPCRECEIERLKAANAALLEHNNELCEQRGYTAETWAAEIDRLRAEVAEVRVFLREIYDLHPQANARASVGYARTMARKGLELIGWEE